MMTFSVTTILYVRIKKIIWNSIWRYLRALHPSTKRDIHAKIKHTNEIFMDHASKIQLSFATDLYIHLLHSTFISILHDTQLSYISLSKLVFMGLVSWAHNKYYNSWENLFISFYLILFCQSFHNTNCRERSMGSMRRSRSFRPGVIRPMLRQSRIAPYPSSSIVKSTDTVQ